MRLNEFDPNSISVEDQRGRRFPMGGGGKIGCGTIVIAIIAALVFGVDPAQMLGGMQDVQEQQSPQAVPGGQVSGGGTHWPLILTVPGGQFGVMQAPPL